MNESKKKREKQRQYVTCHSYGNYCELKALEKMPNPMITFIYRDNIENMMNETYISEPE